MRLFKNGVEAASYVLKNGEMNCTFENLVKEDADGKAYVYTVKEDAVEGYSSTIDGFAITNTFNDPPDNPDPGNPDTPDTPANPGTPDNPKSPSTPDKPATPKQLVKTGDPIPVAPLVALLAVTGTSLCALGLVKKRADTR